MKSRLEPNGAYYNWMACLPTPPSLASAIVQGELRCRLLMQLFYRFADTIRWKMQAPTLSPPEFVSREWSLC